MADQLPSNSLRKKVVECTEELLKAVDLIKNDVPRSTPAAFPSRSSVAASRSSVAAISRKNPNLVN